MLEYRTRVRRRFPVGPMCRLTRQGYRGRLLGLCEMSEEMPGRFGLDEGEMR
jgi:hypothetical protein